MKKNLVLATLLTGSFAYGATIQPFIGIDANKITASDMKVNWSDYYRNVLDDQGEDTFSGHKDNSFGIKIGANIDNNHRVYLYHTNSKDNETVNAIDAYGDQTNLNQKITYTTLNYDYKFTGYSVTPYLGAHAGYGKLSFQNNDQANQITNGNVDKQFIYGVQTGMIIPITNNIEFDLGLAYTKLNFQTSINDVGGDWVSKADCKVDDMMKYSFGINYKF